MSEHLATIDWNRNGADFDYKSYSRNHTWTFENRNVIQASAAPKYLGDAANVDPEEAFVAALSSCHMLTLLAILSNKGYVLDRYLDGAVGHLERVDSGKLAVTRVELHPQLTFADDRAPTPAELDEMHHTAHEQCFIANSVRTEITIEQPQPAS